MNKRYYYKEMKGYTNLYIVNSYSNVTYETFIFLFSDSLGGHGHIELPIKLKIIYIPQLLI